VHTIHCPFSLPQAARGAELVAALDEEQLAGRGGAGDTRFFLD
jgi:hypothetical protein